MACGCPVVASRTGALPEIAGDAAVYCDPHDPEGIGQAILDLVSDRELHQSQVEKGLERARLFTWERCARETLAVIEEVARLRGTDR